MDAARQGQKRRQRHSTGLAQPSNETRGDRPPKRPNVAGSRAQTQDSTRPRQDTRDDVVVIPDSSVIDPDEDDHEIPYTHSRSQSPILPTSSDVEPDVVVIESSAPIASRKTAKEKVKGKPDVIDLDNDMAEYYVISDDEDNDDNKDMKTVDQQLEDNKDMKFNNINATVCGICFDSPKVTLVLPCGHIFCSDCTLKALSSSKSSNKSSGPCPLCRKTTRYNSVMVAKFKKKRQTLEGI